jgi:hypothetical protein
MGREAGLCNRNEYWVTQQIKWASFRMRRNAGVETWAASGSHNACDGYLSFGRRRGVRSRQPHGAGLPAKGDSPQAGRPTSQLQIIRICESVIE